MYHRVLVFADFKTFNVIYIFLIKNDLQHVFIVTNLQYCEKSNPLRLQWVYRFMGIENIIYCNKSNIITRKVSLDRKMYSAYSYNNNYRSSLSWNVWFNCTWYIKKSMMVEESVKGKMRPFMLSSIFHVLWYLDAYLLSFILLLFYSIKREFKKSMLTINISESAECRRCLLFILRHMLCVTIRQNKTWHKCIFSYNANISVALFLLFIFQI